MKFVKRLGLAAVLAGAMMTIAGTGAASATILCSVEPAEGSPGTKGTVCPLNRAYGGGVEVHGVLEAGEHVTFTDEELNADVTCKKSTIAGTTEGEGSATETEGLKNIAWTFEECTSPFFGGVACTVTLVKGGTIEVHWTADTFHGTLTSNEMELTTNCKTVFGDVHCLYKTAGTDLGLLTGGVLKEQKATIDIASAVLPQVATSALCPEETKLDAKYEVTAPKPLYVAAHT